MKQPVTELDTRFSDRTRSRPTGKRLAAHSRRPSCSGSDRPSRRSAACHAALAVWLDDAIHFATGPGEQKAVNLRTNQNVILTTGCNEWEGGSTSWSRARPSR